MSGIEIDAHEVRELDADLRGAPFRVQYNAEKYMRTAARMVEREVKRDARGHRYLPHFPRAVGHDILGPLEAEIGFATGGQGSLAHIIVGGSVNNAPVYDFMAGPRRALPRIVRGFADVAEDSVFGGRE